MADRKLSLMKGTPREPLSPISKIACSRTPRTKTVRKSVTKTPSSKTGVGNTIEGDRFIPNRSANDMQRSHHLIMKGEQDENYEGEDDDYAEKMKQNLNLDLEEVNQRILQMKIKPPTSKEGEVAQKMLYMKTRPTPAKYKSTRHIPSQPDKILDAPDIIDDYYLNLLHWGNNGLIAVPLHSSIYLWNSETGSVEELFGDRPIDDPDVYVTSVRWITEGNFLAVGLSNGIVELWDAVQKKRVRAMTSHTLSRVGCLDWNEHILTSGSRSGSIHNHDVRVAEHHVSSFLYHTQDVCGLEWQQNGRLLASGANDNMINVWDLASTETTTSTQTPNEIVTPLHTLSGHTAAVKAVSWCPWQRNVLASGGGTLDRHIRIWNTASGPGALLQSQDTMSQISGILWSGTYKEIICSHGEQMTIWKYPSMKRETELTGHTGRILNITMSPNGHIVASAGADETLRLWKCFEPDQKKVKPAKKVAGASDLTRHSIR